MIVARAAAISWHDDASGPGPKASPDGNARRAGAPVRARLGAAVGRRAGFSRNHLGHAGETPPEGWDAERLRAAEARFQATKPTAVMVVHDGHVVAAWGDVARTVNVASVRKSVLSALYGIAVAEGRIDITRTLAELAVQDNEPRLTAAERQATIRDLLMSRSGIYHGAAYETFDMARARPPRGSHAPGEFWYYNNWDFNALGTIYTRLTGEDIFEAVQRRIARPTGWEDYEGWRDGRLIYESVSQHPAYAMLLSTRDLARLGLLYLNDGVWAGKRIVPAAWVREFDQALVGSVVRARLRLHVVGVPGRARSCRRRLRGARQPRPGRRGDPLEAARRRPDGRPPRQPRRAEAVALLPAAAPDRGGRSARVRAARNHRPPAAFSLIAGGPTLRIHHLNCGLMEPLGGAMFDGVSGGATAKLACHCLLVETDQGLVLVDTGFGLQDVRQPYRRISPFFVMLDNIRFDPRLTAIRQIERLGFSARDVRHIVMTHLDFDHTGGIEDFPWAAVHVSARELDASRSRDRFSRYAALPERPSRRRAALGNLPFRRRALVRLRCRPRVARPARHPPRVAARPYGGPLRRRGPPRRRLAAARRRRVFPPP